MNDIFEDIDALKDHINDLILERNRLEIQVKKQKEVIDRAIEYIEKFIPIDEDTILMKERQRNYLLDILNEVSE